MKTYKGWQPAHPTMHRAMKVIDLEIVQSKLIPVKMIDHYLENGYVIQYPLNRIERLYNGKCK